jgi:FPC/CPF motif-containing protein YcgG
LYRLIQGVGNHSVGFDCDDRGNGNDDLEENEKKTQTEQFVFQCRKHIIFARIHHQNRNENKRYVLGRDIPFHPISPS